MCPVCLATALLMAGKVAATGGVAAIAIQKFSGKNALDKANPTSSKENSK